MLKSFRKHTKTIIWVVVLSFVLWGGYSVGTQFQKEGRIAGELFGEEISFQDFNMFYRATQIFSFGDTLPNDPDILKQQTWQNMMLAYEAKNRNIDISDEEVRNEILRLFSTQQMPEFSTETYKVWLKNNLKETPRDFENKVREMLRIRKLINQIHEKPVDEPTDEEIRLRYLGENAKLSLEVAHFTTLEQADQFYEDIHSATPWAKALPEDITTEKQSEPLSLIEVSQKFRLPQQAVLSLFEEGTNSVTEPFPSGDAFIVTRALEIIQPEDATLTSELQANYRDQIIMQKKYQRFRLWGLDLEQKAELKDYLPSSNPANND